LKAIDSAMTSNRYVLSLSATITVAGFFLVGASAVFADDERSAPASSPADGQKIERAGWKRDGESRRPGGESPFDSLTEAEKAELRSAMDAVWHDPAVLAARESMQKAGDAYKEALRKSMENTNPKIREILSKMMEGHPGGGWGHRPERRPEDVGEEKAPGDEKDPPFFKALSEEVRQILREGGRGRGGEGGDCQQGGRADDGGKNQGSEESPRSTPQGDDGG
jgi:hypothetical protein